MKETSQQCRRKLQKWEKEKKEAREQYLKPSNRFMLSYILQLNEPH